MQFTTEKRTPPKKPKKRSGFAKARKILGIFAAIFAVCFVIGFAVVLYFSASLPDIDKLAESQTKPSITILDANNNFLASYGDSYTEYVKFKDVPQSLIDSIIATEDRRFFDHWGVDLRGLARAMMVNAIKGRLVQGGSTLTQQLAKNTFLKPDRNLKRKIQEAILAVWMEKRYSKEQIFEMYVNNVYLGSGVYGVDAASRKYFKKSAKKLNLYESALIAGLLKAPSSYSPMNNLKASQARTEQVLENMVDAGKITDKQMRKAYRQGASLKFDRPRDSDRYFTDYVVDLIPSYLSKNPEKIIVKTTFEPSFQKYAEDAVAKNMLEFGDNLKASEAALVALNPDGGIAAMIGGSDYSISQYNRAVQSARQPGSLFKLFVYLAALENGFAPDSIIEDAPVVVDGWKPENFDGNYSGEVTLYSAFARSLNAATVNLAEIVGRSNVIEMAKRLGIKSNLITTPSVVLGASEVNLLEMVGAFAAVAANGVVTEPYAIEQIKTNKGEVLYSHKKVGYAALAPEVIANINLLLKGVVENGTGKNAQIGRDSGGKTGTSQDYRDAWFVGFTPSIVAGVWVGNDDNSPMKKVTGGNIPAKIWHDFMANAVQGMPFEYLPTSVDVGGVTTEDYLNGQPTPDGQPQAEQPQQMQPAPTEAPPTIVDEFWNQISPDNQGTPNEQ